MTGVVFKYVCRIVYSRLGGVGFAMMSGHWMFSKMRQSADFSFVACAPAAPRRFAAVISSTSVP